MNKLATILKDCSEFTVTENGADARSTTKSYVLDLFSSIGALRERAWSKVEDLVRNAMAEDKELTLKTIFHCRDIRNGLGERKVFRGILKLLATEYTEDLIRNIKYIPEFGRWDDLYVFFKDKTCNPVKQAVSDLIRKQFYKDLEEMEKGKPVSLLAKWLKSVNTSSKESVDLAKKTAIVLMLTIPEYRKKLAALRKHIKVTEVAMSSNKWGHIEYDKVPSKAMMTYHKAFKKHDLARFDGYLNDVKNGKKKINSSVLYPSDFYKKAKAGYNETTELQWKSLPDYINDGMNVLPLVDVSGSMFHPDEKPIANSVCLGIYLAERNKSVFKDILVTFSENPEIINISKCKTFHDRVRKVQTSSWGYNTDLLKAFELILDIATKNNVRKEDMVNCIVVISDMQIDSADNSLSGNSKRSYEDFTTTMKKKYEQFGYTLPTLVYWNVNSTRDTFHAHANTENVILVSGSSTTAFKNVTSAVNGVTPYEAMLKVLNSETYAMIK